MTRRHALLLALGLALGAAAGCHGGGSTTDPLAPRGEVSEALLVALAQARNYHHLADVQLADGNTQAAIDAVAQVLDVPFPLGSIEEEDVKLDARARLAKLYLSAGRLAEAERVVADGIAGARRESFFLANLYAVKAKLHEARGEKRQAIEALERSIEINKKLQQEVLKEARP